MSYYLIIKLLDFVYQHIHQFITFAGSHAYGRNKLLRQRILSFCLLYIVLFVCWCSGLGVLF